MNQKAKDILLKQYQHVSVECFCRDCYHARQLEYGKRIKELSLGKNLQPASGGVSQ